MKPVYIHQIETAVPPTCYEQQDARDRIKAQFDDRKAQRIVHHIYNQSAIDKRYSAVRAFGSDDPAELFSQGTDGKWTLPGTGERNARYAEVSKTLSVELARKTLDACPEFEAADISHLITVSCTGFYNPGPDFFIIRELGLAPTTQRFNLGFMGCYAAFPALRMARQFCEANPKAVVMIQCLELCSLHLQMDVHNPESMVAGSLFGDGAACALVSARRPDGMRPAYEIQNLLSDLAPSGEKAMAWDIGEHGFDMVLSSYVPEILGSNIKGIVNPMLSKSGVSIGEVNAWAVHPGGRAILDKVCEGLELDESYMATSRRILREYGNMSSATVLFVLQAMLTDPRPPAEAITAALAFGPGLTVEFALLQRIPALQEYVEDTVDAAEATHSIHT